MPTYGGDPAGFACRTRGSWAAAAGALARRYAAANSYELAHLALWGMTGSWLAWCMLLSIWWPRYFLPCWMPGSVFAASLIGKLAGGMDPLAIPRAANQIFLRPRFERRGLGALALLLLLAWCVPLTVRRLIYSQTSGADESTLQAATFINTQANSSHPLQADPDFLVVGPQSKMWQLYDPVLRTNAFRLIERYSRYDIYQRSAGRVAKKIPIPCGSEPTAGGRQAYDGLPLLTRLQPTPLGYQFIIAATKN
jgi:hypothetical protein